eukprot:TRINITY_DN3868_c1_g1_i1.p1 TRINITY_DN3868_c1_g1~~TRINITY_DN3868_c1_g1_i1.p1  ORF type:complete len:134 (+),score=17.05 TRINITY_DN3868_c1_g1_i1:69-470(+)
MASITQLFQEDDSGSTEVLTTTQQILFVGGIVVCGCLFVLVLAIGKKMGTGERARINSPSNLSHASLHERLTSSPGSYRSGGLKKHDMPLLDVAIAGRQPSLVSDIPRSNTDPYGNSKKVSVLSPRPWNTSDL